MEGKRPWKHAELQQACHNLLNVNIGEVIPGEINPVPAYPSRQILGRPAAPCLHPTAASECLLHVEAEHITILASVDGLCDTRCPVIGFLWAWRNVCCVWRNLRWQPWIGAWMLCSDSMVNHPTAGGTLMKLLLRPWWRRGWAWDRSVLHTSRGSCGGLSCHIRALMHLRIRSRRLRWLAPPLKHEMLDKQGQQRVLTSCVLRQEVLQLSWRKRVVPLEDPLDGRMDGLGMIAVLLQDPRGLQVHGSLLTVR
mmetsp:Transcript_124180/g.362408  ORF Transcript_124180/g.362408 Transcript_124180/m.362408 type:complete len:252 (+) Transcript_124180:574-1329(+)